jgi:hypothetical protein
VNIVSTPEEAMIALSENPLLYSMIFLSFLELKAYGIEETLLQLDTFRTTDDDDGHPSSPFSITVYDFNLLSASPSSSQLSVKEDDSEQQKADDEVDDNKSEKEEEELFYLSLFRRYHVDNVLRPPYTIAALTTVLLSHQRKIVEVLF